MILFNGCHTWELVETPEIDKHIKITTNDFDIYEMLSWSEDEDYIIGYTGETKREGKETIKLKTKISKNDILKIEEKKLHVLNTTILLVGTAAIIFALIFYSSPFGKAVMEGSK
jgi:hypothetical protein